MEARLYLTHFNRGDDICPRCFASIVWRKIGAHKYVPCDKNPVLCLWDDRSGLRVIYRGALISGVRILNKESARHTGGQKPFYALQPHTFTCGKEWRNGR